MGDGRYECRITEYSVLIARTQKICLEQALGEVAVDVQELRQQVSQLLAILFKRLGGARKARRGWRRKIPAIKPVVTKKLDTRNVGMAGFRELGEIMLEILGPDRLGCRHGRDTFGGHWWGSYWIEARASELASLIGRSHDEGADSVPTP